MPRILLVDDEDLILDSLSYSLRRANFEVSTVSEGASVLPALKNFQPDLIVLDVMLPDISGLEVCRQLRAHSAVPVIMLTARGEVFDRILGLEVGADDYLTKPFSFRELLARIQALLRRVAMDRHGELTVPIQIGQVLLDPASRRVYKKGVEVQVSTREFELLYVLMVHAGHAQGRGDLLNRVWGEDWVGDPRNLDVHIRWLRIKIEDDPASPTYIQTVRGYGYRFIGPEELA